MTEGKRQKILEKDTRRLKLVRSVASQHKWIESWHHSECRHIGFHRDESKIELFYTTGTCVNFEEGRQIYGKIKCLDELIEWFACSL